LELISPITTAANDNVNYKKNYTDQQKPIGVIFL